MTDEGYVRYDYAWWTPGWSVQAPTFPTGINGYYDPGMPTDVSMVKITGEFMELGSGRGLEGVFRVRTRADLLHVPSGRLVPAGPLRPLRFMRGGFIMNLPATDDADLVPMDDEDEFVYEGLLTVRGKTHEFTFTLPAATPEVNVTTLM